jgi:hypothetical protein
MIWFYSERIMIIAASIRAAKRSANFEEEMPGTNCRMPKRGGKRNENISRKNIIGGRFRIRRIAKNEASNVARRKRAQEMRKHVASGTSRALLPAPLLETIERFRFAFVNVEDG